MCWWAGRGEEGRRARDDQEGGGEREREHCGKIWRWRERSQQLEEDENEGKRKREKRGGGVVEEKERYCHQPFLSKGGKVRKHGSWASWWQHNMVRSTQLPNSLPRSLSSGHEWKCATASHIFTLKIRMKREGSTSGPLSGDSCIGQLLLECARRLILYTCKTHFETYSIASTAYALQAHRLLITPTIKFTFLSSVSPVTLLWYNHRKQTSLQMYDTKTLSLRFSHMPKLKHRCRGTTFPALPIRGEKREETHGHSGSQD